ncbi:MAG: hypothetical protein GY765_22370, partial [bacterium]|nr:hypothetical protein [bacterium]
MRPLKEPRVFTVPPALLLLLVICLSITVAAPVKGDTGFPPSLDPARKINQYVYDTWTPKDGLPSYCVWAITQTSDGYLWLGTFGGLVRFNGVDFKTFNRDNIPQLTNNRITALCAKKDGGLWIGTESDGLLLYENGTFTRYDSKKELPDNWIFSIIEDHKGDTWIGSSLGLTRCRNGVFTAMSQGAALGDIRDIMEESPGKLWFCSLTDGLYLYESGTFKKYTTADGLSGNDVNSICKDGEGTLWIGTLTHGLNYFREGK